MPAGSVSSSSTLQIFWDRPLVVVTSWWSVCSVISLNSGMPRAHPHTLKLSQITERHAPNKLYLSTFFSLLHSLLCWTDHSFIRNKCHTSDLQQPYLCLSYFKWRMCDFQLTHICPETFNTEYPDAKGLPVLANDGLLQKNTRGKHSTTSSLNKGGPSSGVHVSGMPKWCSANKTSYASEYGRCWA